MRAKQPRVQRLRGPRHFPKPVRRQVRLTSIYLIALLSSLAVNASGSLQLHAVSDKGSSTAECGRDDWLSFTNAGSVDVDLEAYVLADDKGASHEDAFTFAANTSIAARSTMVLCQGGAGSFQFGIGGDDTIILFDKTGNIVDSTTLEGSGAFDNVWTRTQAGWGYVAGPLHAPTNDGFADPVFFAASTVPSITVVLKQPDWDSLASCKSENYLVAKTDRVQACDYHSATCRVIYSTHDATMPCRVKRKGEASWKNMTDKPSLKVKLDQTWNGLKELTLNNAVQDQSKIVERVGYKMYRMAGVLAPRANTARVSLHVAGDSDDFKAYVNIESVSDEQFTEAAIGKDAVVWGGNKAWSWKKKKFETGGRAEFSYSLNACGTKSPNVTLECGVGCGGKKDRSDEAHLEKLVEVAGGCSKEEVGENMWDQLDREKFLRAMVMDRLVNHADSLCGNKVEASKPTSASPTFHGNNFLLYYDRDDKLFGVIPWGLDSIMTGRTMPPAKRTSFDGCVQMQACFDGNILPGCKTDYNRIFRDLVALFQERADELHSLIDVAEMQVKAIEPGQSGKRAASIAAYIKAIPTMFLTIITGIPTNESNAATSLASTTQTSTLSTNAATSLASTTQTSTLSTMTSDGRNPNSNGFSTTIPAPSCALIVKVQSLNFLLSLFVLNACS